MPHTILLERKFRPTDASPLTTTQHFPFLLSLSTILYLFFLNTNNSVNYFKLI